MSDLNPFRKNKINLADYDYELDIKNRILLSDFSQKEIEILEEILYNPIQFPIKRLLDSLDLSIEEIQPTLEKLGEAGLFGLDGDQIVVNKEMRKYFESQIVKFDEEFHPDMEFLQNLLKKVPIHILPLWYQIPRTSSNIFQSLLEKYFLTPQIFQRYLMELNLGDEILNGITHDVFNSSDLMLTSSYIMEKYSLTRDAFEECMLHLEFNFVCCIGYRKKGRKWEEVVTPFHEWRQYLTFMKRATPDPIGDSKNIRRRRPHDYSFIEDMTELVKLSKEGPITLVESEWGAIPEPVTLQKLRDRIPSFSSDGDLQAYAAKLIKKIELLSLGAIEEMTLFPLDETNFWLTLSTEKRALTSYKNHYVALITDTSSAIKLFNERNLRELEKSLCKILDHGWIYFDDFMKGVTIPLSQDSKVELKKVGREWKYTLPSYTDEEATLIESVILDWLFEAGLIAIGSHEGRTCFTVTELGKNIFTS